MERCGTCGMATGGLVMVIMLMSDGSNGSTNRRICQEIIDRLDITGSAVHPKKKIWDPVTVRW
jgi:hypothetical protein